MQRITSVICLAPGKRDRRAAVRPEALAWITECNIRNYSIFRHGDLLFSYFEYVGGGFEADMAKVAADPATQRWRALQDPLQTHLPGTPDGEQWLMTPEIFHHD